MANTTMLFCEKLQCKNFKESAWVEVMCQLMNDVGKELEDHWDEFGEPKSEQAYEFTALLKNDQQGTFDYRVKRDENVIIFSSDEGGDIELISEIVQQFAKKFRQDEFFVWSATYAHTCSSMRIGEFGGGACVVTAAQIHWLDCHEWARTLSEKLQQNTNLMEFGLRLTGILKERGLLFRYKLAEQLHCGVAQIDFALNGDGRVKLEVLKKLSDMAGVRMRVYFD
jgi:hypothetical protein